MPIRKTSYPAVAWNHQVTFDNGYRAQSPYEQSSFQSEALGQEAVFDGRLCYYGKAGGSNIAKGVMCQQSAIVANHKNCAVAANVAAGANVVTATLGATLATANQHAGGTMHVSDGTGKGEWYDVVSHLAVASAGVITLNLKRGIKTALLASVTTSYITLTAAEYNGLVVAPNGGLTAPAAGVPMIAITAAYFGWFFAAGRVVVLTQGTVVIGQPVGLGGTVDGACGPIAADSTAAWGITARANASTKYALVDLCLKSVKLL